MTKKNPKSSTEFKTGSDNKRKSPKQKLAITKGKKSEETKVSNIVVLKVDAVSTYIGIYAKKPKTIINTEPHNLDENFEVPLFRKRNPDLFMDSSKQPVKCWLVPNLSISDTRNKISCWWCRHPFDSIALGCPLKLENEELHTEGFFCSYPCVRSYIKDKIPSPKYVDSDALLHYYFHSTRKGNRIIPFAPHWSLLVEYGGHLDIDEFRDSFGNIVFMTTINTELIRDLSDSLSDKPTPLSTASVMIEMSDKKLS